MPEFHPAERITRAPIKVLPIVLAEYLVRSIVDVGCNVGEWAYDARMLGVNDILGIDETYHQGSLLHPDDEFRLVDLRQPVDLGRKFDLAICLEVAEHLPHESAGTLIDTIVRHADLVLWSAAVPGQGGWGHINCRPPEYWFDHFHARGFVRDDAIVPAIRALDVPSYYQKNIFIYRKAMS